MLIQNILWKLLLRVLQIYYSIMDQANSKILRRIKLQIIIT